MKSFLKNILNYRKPTFWVNSFAIIILIALVLSLTVKQKNNEPDLSLLSIDNSLFSIATSTDFNADDIAYAIENNFDIIESSPKYSLNPGDYITAHSGELESLT